MSDSRTELTFAAVLDFLADHEGNQVYIEIGTRHPEEEGDAFVLKLHKFKLGKVADATDESGERKAPMVMLERIDEPAEGEGDVSRLFINPGQVTKIEGTPGAGLRVWMDEAFYIGLLAS